MEMILIKKLAMKNIIYFSLAIGLIIPMALSVMAQSNEQVRPDITNTSIDDEIIISPGDDIIMGNDDAIISPNPDGTIGVGAESESTSSNWWSTYGMWWAIGIVVVIGIGLIFTKKS